MDANAAFLKCSIEIGSFWRCIPRNYGFNIKRVFIWCNRLKGNRLKALRSRLNSQSTGKNWIATFPWYIFCTCQTGLRSYDCNENKLKSVTTDKCCTTICAITILFMFCLASRAPYAFCVLKFRTNSESGEVEINKLSRSVPQNTLEDWAQRYYRPFVDFIAMFNPRTWILCNRYPQIGYRINTWNILRGVTRERR